MANLIQIKRSLNTASPTSLANGEFAYTANGDVLFIGSNGSVVAIGGVRNPGVLTANQALVANSSSAIDKVIVANAVITVLTANGSPGTNGQVLVSNGTAVYWGTGTSGADTYVQFNDNGVANGVAGFTFTKTSNTLFVGNTITTNNIIANTIDRNPTITLAGDLSGSVTLTNLANGTLTATIQANSVALGTDTTGDYVEFVTAGAGLSGTANGEGSTPTISVVANNGIYANSSGVFAVGANGISVTASGINVLANTGVTANSSGVFIGQPVNTTSSVTFEDITINGNTVLGSNTQDVITYNGLVSSDINPSANITYNLGTNLLRWNEGHFKNVHSVDGYFDGSVSISGNLVVSGNITTTNVSSVIISDPLIYLAGNNYSSDLVDIGFAGNYNQGGTNKHTGLFRHASDDTYYLFKGLTQELDNVTVVNVADPTFAIADLKAYLISSALTTNATSVTISANSTVNVNITANTLTLSTALAGTSGGTGLSSYTAEDILVANSTNGFRKLSLGTSGYVLQSNGTSLVYDVLDGGSF
mgnify:CR=1 FL=1